MPISERQASILHTLVREYIRTAIPVGSEALVERYKLPFSSATVRTELAALEEEGYLTHPHTSAGRIPTDKGYRFFVDKGMEDRELSREDIARLQTELLKTQTQYKRLARGTAKLLAHLSHSLAVAGVVDTEEFHEAGLPELLQEPEFSDVEQVLEVSKVLDALDERFEQLTRMPLKKPQIYIGEENPYARTRHVSMMLATCELPSGERGLLVIIGPKRMQYDRNVGLLEHMTRLLEEKGVYDD